MFDIKNDIINIIFQKFNIYMLNGVGGREGGREYSYLMQSTLIQLSKYALN